MSVTLAIDEELLRAAEKVTNIHDWPTLVEKGLQALCQNGAPGDPLQPPVEIYTADRLAEFAEEETRLENILRRKGLR